MKRQRNSIKEDKCGENELENMEVISQKSVHSDIGSEIKCSVISTSFENIYFSK